jgi:quercetin dioxygenase-like cupin family protein
MLSLVLSLLLQEAKPAEKLEYKPVAPGVSRAVLWGDPDKGPYGAFTRFEPGTRVDLHTHSSDIRIVVLKGAYIFESAGRQIQVRQNDYFLVPAGVEHVSKSDPKEGALFYEESSGKFDLKSVSK